MKTLLLALLLSFSFSSWSQEEDPDADQKQEKQINEIEGLFENDAQEEERRVVTKQRRKKVKKSDAPKTIEDLKILESFDDIAVIQRRYLPKSGRFEFYIAGGTNLNDAFFVGNGVQARFGYYLTERWGLEGVYSLFSNSDREVTKELSERGVDTQGQVATDSFYGLDLKWTPIYGKYSYFNEKIVPFDLYFSLGLGITDPRRGKQSKEVTVEFEDPGKPLTLRLGTGQIFALTKWMAFRWDLSWHFFNIQSPLTGQEELENNLFLHVGLSFFFPEAKYR